MVVNEEVSKEPVNPFTTMGDIVESEVLYTTHEDIICVMCEGHVPESIAVRSAMMVLKDVLDEDDIVDLFIDSYKGTTHKWVKEGDSKEPEDTTFEFFNLRPSGGRAVTIVRVRSDV